MKMSIWIDKTELCDTTKQILIKKKSVVKKKNSSFSDKQMKAKC